MKKLSSLHYTIVPAQQPQSLFQRCQGINFTSSVWQLQYADDKPIFTQTLSCLAQQTRSISRIHTHIIDNDIKTFMRFHRVLKIGFSIATIVFKSRLFRQSWIEPGRIYGYYMQSRL